LKKGKDKRASYRVFGSNPEKERQELDSEGKGGKAAH